MNKTIAEAVAFAKDIKAKVEGVKDVEIAIAPVFPAVAAVAAELKGTNVGVAAQDLFWEKSGAFTGEVSGSLLKDAGCQYVIIAHSERRQYFNETNETAAKKVKAAFEAGLTPILCVGETLKEREDNKTFEVIGSHVHGGLKGLDDKLAPKVVIAYEPVWAIGTGKTATPAQAQEVHAFIRAELAKLFGPSTAGEIRIQYGGSVKPDNVKELMSQKDIDGALVGGASLDPASFEKLVKFNS